MILSRAAGVAEGRRDWLNKKHQNALPPAAQAQSKNGNILKLGRHLMSCRGTQRRWGWAAASPNKPLKKFIINSSHSKKH